MAYNSGAERRRLYSPWSFWYFIIDYLAIGQHLLLRSCLIEARAILEKVLESCDRCGNGLVTNPIHLPWAAPFTCVLETLQIDNNSVTSKHHHLSRCCPRSLVCRSHGNSDLPCQQEHASHFEIPYPNNPSGANTSFQWHRPYPLYVGRLA